MVAAFFQKQHKNVLANVREIEALQPDFYRPNFRPVSYKGRNGEERPAYEVTKAGFTVLAVDESTGCRFARWKPFSRCEGRARSGFDDAGAPAERSETDAILDAV